MRRLLVLAALVVSLAACGGSSGGGNVAGGPAGDPVGAVNNFINAIKAKSLDKLGPLTCAAKRYEIIGSMSVNTSADMLDAMNFDFQDLKVEQTSVSGDAAKVHVAGKLVLTLDPTKGKEAVRKALQAAAPSGTQVTDDQVNQMMTLFASGKPADISSDVDVVKENGGWVVCSKFGTS
jgi:hypothetical protein